MLHPARSPQNRNKRMDVLSVDSILSTWFSNMKGVQGGHQIGVSWFEGLSVQRCVCNYNFGQSPQLWTI